MTAILRYNNSVAYARNVLGWAAAYATGVVPVDLPPITGPLPPIGDTHLDNYEGLGPGLPVNALGLPAGDPLALMPLLGRDGVASQIPRVFPASCRSAAGAAARTRRLLPPQAPESPPPPWMQQPQPACAVFCIQDLPASPPLEPAAGLPVDARALHAPGLAPHEPRQAPGPSPADATPGLRLVWARTGSGAWATARPRRLKTPVESA